MGRGLSDLQKKIMVMAYRNRVNEDRKPESLGADLYKREVLEAHFGFDQWRKGHEEQSPRENGAGNHHFRKADLGEKYQSAHASVSRAFKRLEQRGLATRISAYYSWWSGVNLTPEGLALAEKLTVKSPQKSAKV